MPPFQKSGSKGKEKIIDRTTPWSVDKYDQSRGKWYTDRFNAFGEVEYRYYNSEVVDDSSQSTPRTTSDTSWNSHGQSLTTNDLNVLYTNGNASASDLGTDSGYGQVDELEFPEGQYVAVRGGENNSAGTSSFRHHDEQSMTETFNTLSFSSSIPEDESLSMNAPSTQEQRIANAKKIRRQPNSKNFEELDDRYRVVEEKRQKAFWKIGRVFMMLWTEPARSFQVPANGGTRNGSHLSTVYLNGTAYSEIRRFVVISVGHGSNICSPIQTYSGQGTLKANLPEADQHAIIHTSRSPPNELGYEEEDGTLRQEDLVKDPIRVRSERKDADGTLHHASRLNYSKIYTVENYVRVLNIGMVHENSMPSLLSNCLVKPRAEPTPPRSRTDSSTPRTDRGKASHKHRR